MKSLAVGLLILSSSAFANDCATLIDAAEKAYDLSDLVTAKAKGTAAIKACEKEKTSRHFMVLSAAANQEKDFTSVIKWANEGLKKEPGLPLAYMNICAAHSQMKEYDKAISACETGAKTDSEWKAMILSNLGLAYFSKAVDAGKYEEAIKSEKYFLESSKIDPSIGMNYFYLGTLEHAVKNNIPAAKTLLDKGCKAHDQRACTSLANLPKEAPKAAPKASAGESALVDRLVKNYMKKGLPEAQARTTVQDVVKGLSSLPEAQRLTTLESMVKATE